MSPTYSSAREAAPRGRAPRIPFQKFVLENGLEVILHEDHAEPVVAVCVYYHVGSGREVSGKSGFAHLFEHMLFQGSEHVAGDGHFRLVQAAGGTVNGNTTQDRTFYYETLPSSHLELALWLESDRMGFLLPAMTQEKLDNQRDVVKNERRQSYENRPYGLVHETLCAALYPPGHPYSWPTIGSMADIEAATLEDVAEFFRRYYGPGNATLALGGDFEPEAALALVRRWFGALPGRLPVEAARARTGSARALAPGRARGQGHAPAAHDRVAHGGERSPGRGAARAARRRSLGEQIRALRPRARDRGEARQPRDARARGAGARGYLVLNLRPIRASRWARWRRASRSSWRSWSSRGSQRRSSSACATVTKARSSARSRR
jgi:hypothetical protein